MLKLEYATQFKKDFKKEIKGSEPFSILRNL